MIIIAIGAKQIHHNNHNHKRIIAELIRITITIVRTAIQIIITIRVRTQTTINRFKQHAKSRCSQF